MNEIVSNAVTTVANTLTKDQKNGVIIMVVSPVIIWGLNKIINDIMDRNYCIYVNVKDGIFELKNNT